MVEKIQAIRGMNDILPMEIFTWQKVEDSLRKLAKQYGYQEVRFPILEKTELFKRCIGDVTDIVEKEMYTFIDRNGESLSLRPEGTAGCVRAGIEKGLLYNQIQRWWYLGPMFRHERPQKGRYRQFYQFGMEVFGLGGCYIDAELILMTARLWDELGLKNQLNLQINSLGSSIARNAHKENLVNYFTRHFEYLDADSQRRLKTNPLRILDSKNPDMQELIQKAPQLLDFLDSESQQDFSILQKILTNMGINFTINPRLVRGLDYYNKTVFEWILTDEQQAAQNTVCAGGRYDKLVEHLGGHATPAVGFAIGLERLINLLPSLNSTASNSATDIYFIAIGDIAIQKALSLAEYLHTELPSICLVLDVSGDGMKSQFKRADKSGARFALILGNDEIKSNTLSIKNLRRESPQESISQLDMKKSLEDRLTHE
ncbi:MAG: histidine--tRNA ligase [Pseudomonadota bacterium]|jgi:histidyl-tRNA synthetase